MLTFNKGTIYITGNACPITSDLSPRFQDWTFDMYQEDPYCRFLEPMLANPCPKGEIPHDGYIAEEKFDGHRALCFVTTQGNRFFSRRVSKKTKWYAENTDCLPHLRDYVGFGNFSGTVLDGEITMPTEVFGDVQSVLGALPETAIANQIEKGFAIYNVFDILYYKGINVQKMPLWKRKLLIHQVFRQNWNPAFREVRYFCTEATLDEWVKLKNSDKIAKWYSEPVPRVVENFDTLLKRAWEEGKEGLIVKDIYGKYDQGKRTKAMLKLKGEKTYDCVVMGFEEPTKYYTGKTLDEGGTWDYWECYDDPDMIHTKTMTLAEADEYAPLTKPFAMGWVGAIEVGVWKKGKLVKVAEAKGITDADQEFIVKNGKDMIGKQVVEIKAQEIIDESTGSLRHPRFNRWRYDKNVKDCTWEAFLAVK